MDVEVLPVSARGQLLTAKELADQLSLSVETVWRYTRQKRIPYVEVGPRQYRYDMAQVLAAMDSVAPSVRDSQGQYKAKQEGGEGKKMIYADYLQLPDERGCRHELLEGCLSKDPSPSVRHQRVISRLFERLRAYFASMDPDGEVLLSPLDVCLSDETVVQPDLFYIPGSDAAVFEQTHVCVPPQLVVEVLSAATERKDRVTKMEIYRRAGVVHYWLVDPSACTIEAYSLRKDYYAHLAAGGVGDILTHPDFPGLEVSVEHVFP